MRVVQRAIAEGAPDRRARSEFKAAMGTSSFTSPFIDPLVPWVVCTAIIILAVLAISKDAGVRVLPSWAPESASTSLLTMWQVEGAALGVAFPLLLLVIQFSRDTAVLALSAPKVLMRYTRAYLTGVVLVLGVVLLGVTAIWLPSDETVVVAFFAVFVPGMAMLFGSLTATIRLLLDPGRLREESGKALQSMLAASMTRAWIVNRARRILEDGLRSQSFDVSPFTSLPQRSRLDEWFIVEAPASGVLADIDVAQLTKALGRFRVRVPEATAAANEPDDATRQVTVIMTGALGDVVNAGDLLVAVHGRQGLEDEARARDETLEAFQWGSP